MKSKRVTIINSGSKFRGLTGTIAGHSKASDMYAIIFDEPFHGFVGTLFFAFEFEAI